MGYSLETKAKPYATRETLLCETVFDMTTIICHLANEGKICLPEDSRDTFLAVLTAAREFEKDYIDNGDYLSDVEDYVLHRLDHFYCCSRLEEAYT